MKKVFFDTSVLFSACKSKAGGSSFIFMLCRKGKIQGMISRYVIFEIKQTTSELTQREKQRLNFLILQCKLQMVNEAPERIIESFHSIINKKDAPIVASANLNSSDYLLTLNTKHFMNPKLKTAVRPMKIVTPKDFIINEKLR